MALWKVLKGVSVKGPSGACHFADRSSGRLVKSHVAAAAVICSKDSQQGDFAALTVERDMEKHGHNRRPPIPSKSCGDPPELFDVFMQFNRGARMTILPKRDGGPSQPCWRRGTARGRARARGTSTRWAIWGQIDSLFPQQLSGGQRATAPPSRSGVYEPKPSAYLTNRTSALDRSLNKRVFKKSFQDLAPKADHDDRNP